MILEMTQKELLLMKDLANKAEEKWMLVFRVIGIAMFVAATFESFVTLFLLDQEVVGMNTFKVTFGAVGFVFYGANRALGRFANTIGDKLLSKF